MNKMFVSAALLVSSVFSFSAHATKFDLVYKSNLNNINTDSQLGVNPQTGTVVYNPSKKTLTLFITFSKSSCAPGNICPLYVQPPFQIELPIVEIKQDTCGAKVVVAEINNPSVDGDLDHLEITDNSTNHCQYIRAIASVEGEFHKTYFDRYHGTEVTATATFEGDSFASTTKVSE
ncbi:MAG: hypothetical protein ACXVCP_00570 [Bdellovibrio sp.]